MFCRHAQAQYIRRRQVYSAVRARFLLGFLTVYAAILAYAAWVIRQPTGTYTAASHAKRVAPVFYAPLVAYAVYTVSSTVHDALNRHADAQIRKQQDRMRKIVGDLKDSTRYKRTQMLLEQYDPDWTPPQPDVQALQKPTKPNTRKSSSPDKNVTGGATAAVITEAGSRLSATVGQFLSQFAQTLIADDPTLIATLRQVQEHAHELEKENLELRRMLAAQAPSGAFGSPISSDIASGGVNDRRDPVLKASLPIERTQIEREGEGGSHHQSKIVQAGETVEATTPGDSPKTPPADENASPKPVRRNS